MSWDASKYFAKCKIYWNRATTGERDSDQFLLNVAFSCEFLIRGSLCTVNPALNANLDDRSILYASGVDKGAEPRTIPIGKALERLRYIIPGISDEITKITTLLDARNRELHSDLDKISQVSPSDIMPSVYALFVTATTFSNQDIETVMGKVDATQAQQVVEATKKDRKRRVEELIESYRDSFLSLPEEEQKQKRDSVDKSIIAAVFTSGYHLIKHECPACKAEGSLVGRPIGRSAPLLRDDEIIQEVRVIPSKFECKCCGLEISGLGELMAAGFDHEFCSSDSVDPVEHLNIDLHEYIAEEHADIVAQAAADDYHYGIYKDHGE